MIFWKRKNAEQNAELSPSLHHTHFTTFFFCLAVLVFTPGYEIILGTIMLVGPALLPVYVDRLSRSSETSG